MVIMVIQDYYQSIEEAILAVKNGKAWAAIAFDPKFSEYLVYRMVSGKDVDNITLERSEISLWQDNTSKFLKK